ncbi:ABC transporter permease subunit [Modestobacter sp. I12A-02628]|uniref:ABC transporter permease subunit n=1 Tax=Goekera deserti TaxID=2497753 RepID=A0A7K3WES3_9ACTN|nr:ABC transporter permease subunit [Goekera deserti]MPQ97976.1 ABC transporter permease subunit [Goekera deserti]NDI48623.1 ABC transporter permease subunit [Goekera deserti]NEL54998.1 ABC transporter permease subunit [Goekera deserti]
MTALRRLTGVGLAAWFLLPLVPLVLWAAADVWRAPAALPQQWGSSGWSAAAAAGGWAAAGRSLGLAAVVAVLGTLLGAAAAAALDGGRLRAPRTITALLLAPVALPPLAVALGLDVLLLRLGVPAPVGVVAVLTVAALPYTTYALRVALAGMDRGYAEEARLLGATPAVVWRRVRLPLLAPAVATAALLAFLVGWSDYVVTLTVGGGQLVTLPLLLGSAASGVGDEPTVAALALSAVLPPLAAALLVARLARGRTG